MHNDNVDDDDDCGWGSAWIMRCKKNSSMNNVHKYILEIGAVTDYHHRKFKTASITTKKPSPAAEYVQKFAADIKYSNEATNSLL